MHTRHYSSRIVISTALFLCCLQSALAQVGGGRDGYVVWESLQNNQWRIYKANLDGSGKTRISGNENGAHQGAVISTDGRRVAYTRLLNDNGSEYPARGKDLEVWVVNRDGSNRRKVFDNARDAGECRMLRWLGPSHLAIGTVSGTFRVYIPESGTGVIQAGTLPGGRRTADNGLIVHTFNGRVLMPSPTGNKAYFGDGGKGRIYEIDENHRAVDEMSPGGCQAFVSADDKYGVGAEYRGMDNTVTFTSPDPTKVKPHRKGTYDGTDTDGYHYDYFPTIGNDNTVGAIGKSPGEHGHKSANYEIFVFDLSLQDGLLRPTGPRVNVSNNPTCDRWPDVWVSTGPQPPVLNLDKTSLAFFSEFGATGNPPSRQVNVTNIGGGTLPPLTATAEPGWLDATVSGTGNDQSITVLVQRGTLAADTHTGTVRVDGSGVTAVEIAVTYRVKGPQIASSIEITPAGTTLAPNGSVEFGAQVIDEQGDPMSGSVVWSVDGGGFIDQSGHFTSNGTVGIVTVTAMLETDNTISATAAIEITAIPTNGIQLWFRADAGVTASQDGRVRQWQDQSPNANHAGQSTAAHQPLLVDDGYNGKPVLRFDGDQFLDFDEFRFSDFTVVLVFRVSRLTDRLLQWALSGVRGENQGYHVGSLDQSGFPTFLAFDGTCMAEAADPIVGRFRHMVSVNDALYFDGAAVPLADTIPWEGHRNNVGTLSGMALSRMGGYAKGGGNNFNGDIAEVICYNRTLSVAERFVVDAYLNEKYGVEPITVIAPNGGDVYSPGEEIVISWKAATVNSVNLFYSTDGGRSWEPINARRSVNHDDQKWGSYPWTVPQTHAEHCLVRVEDYTNSNVFDVSDNRFSIGTISAANNRRSLKAGAFLVRYRRGKLHVSGLVPSVNTAVHLYDCRGGLVARWHGENRENATVDLSGAGSGIYHAIVKNGERRRIVSFTHAR